MYSNNIYSTHRLFLLYALILMSDIVPKMPVCNMFSTEYIQRLLFYVWSCDKLNISPESSYLTNVCSKMYRSNKEYLNNIFIQRLQTEQLILATIRDAEHFNHYEHIHISQQYYYMIHLLLIIGIPLLHNPDHDNTILSSYIQNIRDVDHLIMQSMKDIPYQTYIVMRYV